MSLGPTGASHQDVGSLRSLTAPQLGAAAPPASLDAGKRRRALSMQPSALFSRSGTLGSDKKITIVYGSQPIKPRTKSASEAQNIESKAQKIEVANALAEGFEAIELKSKLSEEIKDLKSPSTKGDSTKFENLQKVALLVNEGRTRILQALQTSGDTFNVKLDGMAFSVIKGESAAGEKHLYVRLGNAGGHLGTGMVKTVEVGLKILEGGSFEVVAIARANETAASNPKTIQELTKEHELGSSLAKEHEGFFSSREVVNLGKKETGYISPLSHGNYKVDFDGKGACQQLDKDKKLENAKRLFAALDFMHAKGITHNDIKGDNIFLDEKGKAGLADFGEALTFKEHAELMKSKEEFTSESAKLLKEYNEIGVKLQKFTDKDPEYKTLYDQQGDLGLKLSALDRRSDVMNKSFDKLKGDDIQKLAITIRDSFTAEERDIGKNPKFKEFIDLLDKHGLEMQQPSGRIITKKPAKPV